MSIKEFIPHIQHYSGKKPDKVKTEARWNGMYCWFKTRLDEGFKPEDMVEERERMKKIQFEDRRI